MRYIANSEGYVQEVSFGAVIIIGDQACTEYTGAVPAGYDDLVDWFAQEGDKLHRWQIVEGNLTKIEDAPEPVADTPVGAKKLWENENSSAAFEPKELPLDLSEYVGVFVHFKGVASGSGRYVSGFIPVGGGAYIQCHALDGSLRQRNVQVRDTGVEFGAGYNVDKENNSFAVPVAVYGFIGNGSGTFGGGVIDITITEV